MFSTLSYHSLVSRAGLCAVVHRIRQMTLAGQSLQQSLLPEESTAAQVMELVELRSLRDALVGMPGSSGLSVEQRKRLTIAVELVANPSIVFMDEPTSGARSRQQQRVSSGVPYAAALVELSLVLVNLHRCREGRRQSCVRCSALWPAPLEVLETCASASGA